MFDFLTDLLGENAGGQGNALGFQTFGGSTVTVLASKTSRELYFHQLLLLRNLAGMQRYNIVLIHVST